MTPTLLPNSFQQEGPYATAIIPGRSRLRTSDNIPKNPQKRHILNFGNNTMKALALLFVFFFCSNNNNDRGVIAKQMTFPSCTGILRVCDEDEDPWHGNAL
jgi:hypothetical protein